MESASPPVVAETTGGPTSIRGAARRLRRSAYSRSWIVAGIVLAAILTLVVFGEAISGQSPGKVDTEQAFLPPVWAGGSWAHPFGTDQLGRDILARLSQGGRVSMLVALAAVAVAGALGTAIGLFAGYRRGAADAILARLIDAQLSIPVVALAITVVVAFGSSIPALVAVIAAANWVTYARVVRAEASSLRSRDFLALARTAGLPQRKLITRHLIPNVLPSVIVLASLDVGLVIIYETSLSFLGLGVQPPDASWGLMIAEGREFLGVAAWIVLIPAITVILVVFAANLLGDLVRDRLDPTLREIE